MAFMEPVATPELDKQSELIHSGRAPAVQDFLDWLAEQGIVLGRYQEIDGFREPMLMPIFDRPEKLMADHFGIDLDKIESERRALLKAIRESNNAQ